MLLLPHDNLFAPAQDMVRFPVEMWRLLSLLERVAVSITLMYLYTNILKIKSQFLLFLCCTNGCHAGLEPSSGQHLYASSQLTPGVIAVAKKQGFPCKSSLPSGRKLLSLVICFVFKTSQKGTSVCCIDFHSP